MKLIVNGETLEAKSPTLAELLCEFRFEGGWIATAVNGDFVPAGERDERALSDGDRIEILSPMQGG